jgi:hypothetical protein
VLPNHVYIKAGSKAAFSHHKIPASHLSIEELHSLLAEVRSLEAWVALFSSINGQQLPQQLQSVVTPARKRKQRYLTEDDDSKGAVYARHAPHLSLT